ncbi:MAG: hypothetical protein VKJ06_08465 [Vampirovibrionales bacterium]|nr:hypothetical protein [Vampirovibrionales bacterium]
MPNSYSYPFVYNGSVIGNANQNLPTIPANDPFEGKASDFLSPKYIQNQVGNVSLNIKTVSSNRGVFGGVQPLGKNPSADDVLRQTQRFVNKPLTTFNWQVPVLDAPFIQPVPDISNNPRPVDILAASGFFQENLQGVGNRLPVFPQPGYPLGQNPAAMDVLGLTNHFSGAIAGPWHGPALGFGYGFGYAPYGYYFG